MRVTGDASRGRRHTVTGRDGPDGSGGTPALVRREDVPEAGGRPWGPEGLGGVRTPISAPPLVFPPTARPLFPVGVLHFFPPSRPKTCVPYPLLVAQPGRDRAADPVRACRETGASAPSPSKLLDASDRTSPHVRGPPIMCECGWGPPPQGERLPCGSKKRTRLLGAGAGVGAPEAIHTTRLRASLGPSPNRDRVSRTRIAP